MIFKINFEADLKTDLEADLQIYLRADFEADFEEDFGSDLASEKKSQIEKVPLVNLWSTSGRPLVDHCSTSGQPLVNVRWYPYWLAISGRIVRIVAKIATKTTLDNVTDQNLPIFKEKKRHFGVRAMACR